MKILLVVEHRVKVVDPAKLEKRDGLPWCEEHEEYFQNCICPKPDSSAEKDGWHLEKDGRGSVYAYPTQRLYEELQLWIQRRGDKLVCTRCNDEFQISGALSEIEMQDMIAAFFSVHEKCDSHNASEQN